MVRQAPGDDRHPRNGGPVRQAIDRLHGRPRRRARQLASRPPMNANTTIRPARPDDAATIAALIRELAAYERLGHEAKATADSIRRDLFGPRPFAEAMIAEVDGVAVGFALYFHHYSTFR